MQRYIHLLRSIKSVCMLHTSPPLLPKGSQHHIYPYQLQIVMCQWLVIHCKESAYRVNAPIICLVCKQHKTDYRTCNGTATPGLMNAVEVRMELPRMLNHICSDGFKHEHGVWTEYFELQKDLEGVKKGQ